MATFVQMIQQNNHQQVGVVPTLGSGNCYTFSHVGLSVGITIDQSQMGKMIFLGGGRYGGDSRYCLCEFGNEPTVINGSVVLAAASKMGENGSTQYRFRRPKAEVPYSIVKIETGHRNLVKTNHGQSIKLLSGKAVKVAGGNIRTKHGSAASIEELWIMAEGAEVLVEFANGDRKVLARKNETLVLTSAPSVSEEPKVTAVTEIRAEAVTTINWEKAMEASNAVDEDGKSRIPTRDWGRYQMINLAQTGEQWQMICNHLVENIRDVRPRVHDAFIRGCKDVGLLLSFGVAYRAVPANKAAAESTGIPDFVRQDAGKKGPPASRLQHLKKRRMEQAEARTGGSNKKDKSEKKDKKNKKK